MEGGKRIGKEKGWYRGRRERKEGKGEGEKRKEEGGWRENGRDDIWGLESEWSLELGQVGIEDLLVEPGCTEFCLHFREPL